MLERMEGTVTEEVEWKPLYSKRKPLYGGAEGDESLIEEATTETGKFQ